MIHGNTRVLAFGPAMRTPSHAGDEHAHRVSHGPESFPERAATIAGVGLVFKGGSFDFVFHVRLQKKPHLVSGAKDQFSIADRTWSKRDATFFIPIA